MQKEKIGKIIAKVIYEVSIKKASKVVNSTCRVVYYQEKYDTQVYCLRKYNER